jgi:DNA-binding beta-propeller fold protein YncE
MKQFGFGLFALLGPVLFAQQAPEISYFSVPGLLKLPRDMNLGEASGVAVNSKGHIFVFTRSNSATGTAYGAAAAQLFEFDADGKFVREIAKGLYAWSFAHTVRIDGDDNIWAVDKGSNMVVRLNSEGHVTMVFGRKQEATDREEPPKQGGPPPRVLDGMFNQPTDIAWNAEGDMFVSDGYINSRVAKYDRNGAWVKSWGEPGQGPGQFKLPHAIAVDARGLVYVADRANARIQVFDSDGKFLRQIVIDVPAAPGTRPLMGYQAPPPLNAPPGSNLSYRPGAPAAICITPGPGQVMFVADLYPGRIYKLDLDGKLLGMLGRNGRQLGEFGGMHQLACPSENVVYVAELLNWRVQKLILQPEARATTSSRTR